MKRTLRLSLATIASVSLPLLSRAADESLKPPFGGAESQTEPIVIIAVILQVLLGLVGAGALLMFVWGGFHMIFSGGNSERLEKGKQTLVWAVIGMAVILSSYAVLGFVFDIFKTASSA
jgi:hypothetical protein